MMTQPVCHDCGTLGRLVNGDAIYPHRPELHYKVFYKCTFCKDTYVGCHPGTTRPLGRMANKQLRDAKQRVHRVLDPLWETKMAREGLGKGEARGRAYRWLAHELGIKPEDCHVGMFDVATCARAEAICKPYAERLK